MKSSWEKVFSEQGGLCILEAERLKGGIRGCTEVPLKAKAVLFGSHKTWSDILMVLSFSIFRICRGAPILLS